MTTKTKIQVLVVTGYALPILAVTRYAIDTRTNLSFAAMIGNLSTSAFILYLAKKLHDKSQRDK